MVYQIKLEVISEFFESGLSNNFDSISNNSFFFLLNVYYLWWTKLHVVLFSEPAWCVLGSWGQKRTHNNNHIFHFFAFKVV